jgi:peptidoglycan/LPS O-acetylase OafA/YrhL
VPQLSFSPGLHPLYAVASIALLAIIADALRRVVPFYRRELLIEKQTRLTPLDGLRGILCFGVMYHHSAITHAFLKTGRWEETPSVFYVLLGQTSVAFFFCITAFLFWGQALDRKGEISVVAFLRGRWFRVVPLYVFAAAAALYLVRSQIHWSRHSTKLGVAEMGLMGLICWGKIGTADVNMANAGVIWTLQYEWIFYLALPALAMLVKAGKPWRILLVAMALWVLQGLDVDMDFKAYFLSGILAAHTARTPKLATALRSIYVSILLVIMVIAMPPRIFNSPGWLPHILGGYGWLPLIWTTLIFIPIACGNSLFGILNYPGLRLMGMVSYSVYLLHGFFLRQSTPFLKKALAQGDMRYWLAILTLACAVLLCCSITYRCIEWPFIRLEKRMRSLPTVASQRARSDSQI